jgi:hypothetical protein
MRLLRRLGLAPPSPRFQRVHKRAHKQGQDRHAGLHPFILLAPGRLGFHVAADAAAA